MRVSQPIIVSLPSMAKAATEDGRRIVYFEASRDGVVDREGEMVAVSALWASRDLMLAQGDLDISHWSHLSNPLTGRPQPEYRIGQPIDIRRSANGRSVFVKGEIYRARDTPPAGSSAEWSERFWHSITGQTPPAKWFPSVYGTITGVEMVRVKGRDVRRITACEWYSVGFALRAQHPDLPAVSLDPMGVFAKADQAAMPGQVQASGAVHMDWGTFAKAAGSGIATVGAMPTDTAARTGVGALARSSVEGSVKRLTPSDMNAQQARQSVLQAVKSGAVGVNLRDLTRAFRVVGYGESQARALLRDLETRSR